LEVIVFPDTEEDVRAHLASELPLFGADVPAHIKLPTDRPSEFVRVYRVGGPRRDAFTDNGSYALEGWAQTESRALALLNIARGIVNALPGHTIGESRVYTTREFAGPGLLPDPISKQSRYTLTVSIAVRGSVRERED